MTLFTSTWPTSLFCLLLVAGVGCDADDHDHDHEGPDAGMSGADADPGPDADAPAPMPTSSRGRLAVAGVHLDAPRLWIVDLDDGEIVGEATLLAPASVYASAPTSPYGYVNQRLANIVDIVSAGTQVAQVAGEEGVMKSSPRLISTFLDGALPTHWVEHDGWVVVFNDGDGSFDYLYESSLETPRVILRRAETDGAHHGVALVSHGYLLASNSLPTPTPSNPDARRANGLTVRSLAAPAQVISESHDCPGLHGEAANAQAVGVGCTDGVLVAAWKNGGFELRKLAHPASLPQPNSGSPYRVGTLAAHPDVPTLLGNWGPNGFVIIDLESEPAEWTYVDVGALRRSFAVSHDGASVLVLAGDGKLHRFDPVTGASQGAPLAVTEPFETTAGTPVLVLDRQHAFVVDPRNGAIREIDLAAWATARTFDVEGAPASGAVFGAIP